MGAQGSSCRLHEALVEVPCLAGSLEVVVLVLVVVVLLVLGLAVVVPVPVVGAVVVPVLVPEAGAGGGQVLVRVDHLPSMPTTMMPTLITHMQGPSADPTPKTARGRAAGASTSFFLLTVFGLGLAMVR